MDGQRDGHTHQRMEREGVGREVPISQGRALSSDTVAKTFVWDGDQPVGGKRKKPENQVGRSGWAGSSRVRRRSFVRVTEELRCMEISL